MAEYLPGDIRQRIRDLLAERQMSVAELAERVGCDETTLGRFIRGDTKKIGDQTITRIAGVFCVSTDFLLGVTNIPDRKNYDIEELGLSVAAAKNLYTGKVNPRMVNLLLENDRFAYLTTLLARYLDEDLSAGIAAQNQLFNSVSSLLTGYARSDPEDRQAALETAQTVRSVKQPPTIADTNALQSVFLQVVHELKRDSTSNRQEAQSLTKDVAEEVFSNLQKGQETFDPHSVTPEQMVDAILQTVDGDLPTKQRSFLRKALLLFFPRREPVNRDDQ